MPPNFFQRLGDWYEQRAEYRKQALASLRKREGLSTSERLVGTFYHRDDGCFYREPPGQEVFLDTTLYPNGQGGYATWAVGTRKGVSREEASQNWGGSSSFEILEVAEDGRKLSDELNDLNRDAGGMEMAEKVSHGEAGEQAPGLELYGTSDAEIDEALQEFLKRGRK